MSHFFLAQDRAAGVAAHVRRVREQARAVPLWGTAEDRFAELQARLPEGLVQGPHAKRFSILMEIEGRIHERIANAPTWRCSMYTAYGADACCATHVVSTNVREGRDLPPYMSRIQDPKGEQLMPLGVLCSQCVLALRGTPESHVVVPASEKQVENYFLASRVHESETVLFATMEDPEERRARYMNASRRNNERTSVAANEAPNGEQSDESSPYERRPQTSTPHAPPSEVSSGVAPDPTSPSQESPDTVSSPDEQYAA